MGHEFREIDDEQPVAEESNETEELASRIRVLEHEILRSRSAEYRELTKKTISDATELLAKNSDLLRRVEQLERDVMGKTRE